MAVMPKNGENCGRQEKKKQRRPEKMKNLGTMRKSGCNAQKRRKLWAPEEKEAEAPRKAENPGRQ